MSVTQHKTQCKIGWTICEGEGEGR